MKCTILLGVLFTVSATTQAFTLTEAHCALLTEETARTVQAKEIGVTVENRERDLVLTYVDSPDKTRFLDMWPYMTEVIEEYYQESMLAEIDYVGVVERQCIAGSKVVGTAR